MNFLQPAQAGAQLMSLVVFSLVSGWYVVPWLKGVGRARALTAFLWVPLFRYRALQAISAQKSGFPISDGGLAEIVVGDVVGAVIALVTIAALRHRARLAIPLAWFLVAETTYDTVSNIRGGVHENLMGAASGVTWMILGFYVPMVVISLVLMAWQLYARRGETLAEATRRAIQDHGPAAARP